jgi:hypothetical protein
MAIEFSGLVIPFNRRHLLLYGPDAAAFGSPLFGPPVFLRPGYKLVWENDFLLPEQAIDDRGQRYDGVQAPIGSRHAAIPFRAPMRSGSGPPARPLGLEMKEIDLAVLAYFASGACRPALRSGLTWRWRRSPFPTAMRWRPSNRLAHWLICRALPFYRLAPGAFGAGGAALVSRLLATGQADWRVTFDDLDDTLDR